MKWIRKNRIWILIALAIILIAHMALSNIDLMGFLAADNMLREIRLPIWLSVIVFMILYAIQGAMLVVSTVMLYVAAGLVFPTWVGIPVTYAGLTVSLSVGYFIGMKLGQDKVNNMIAKRKKISDFLHGNQDNILLLCFVSRILPISFGLVSAFFGALKVPFHKYLFMSLLGVSPLMLPIIFAGTAIANPLSPGFLVPFIISLCISLIIFVIFKAKVRVKPNQDRGV